MAHAREQIREAVVTQLTGLSTTGSRAYKSRVYPRNALPCLTVYTLSESVNQDNAVLGLDQFRDLMLAVHIHARSVEDVDDSVDTISAEVEAALHDDTTLGGLTHWLEYESIEIEVADGAERPTASAIMTFRVQYRVDATDPETIIS